MPDGRRLRIFVAMVFVVLAAGTIAGTRMRDHHGDFGIYRRASAALYAQPQQAIYEAEQGYVYPPLLAVAIRPLSNLGDPWAGMIWDIARWCSLGLSLLLCEKLLRRIVSARASATIVLICCITVIRPMWYDTLNGNVNAFLLLALIAGWWFLVRHGPIAAGTLWAFMLSIKPAGALAILAPLAKRRAGALQCWLAAGLTIITVNLILPAMTLGWQSAWTQLAGYPSGAGATPDDVFSRYSNQSLGVSVGRIFTRWNLLEQDDMPEFVSWARIVAGALLLLWIGIVLLRVRRRGEHARLEWGVAMLAVSGTLISPVVWIAHYLMLVPAYVILLGEATRRQNRWAKLLATSVTLFAVTLISLKATVLNTLMWAPLSLLIALTVFAATDNDPAVGRSANHSSVSPSSMR